MKTVSNGKLKSATMVDWREGFGKNKSRSAYYIMPYFLNATGTVLGREDGDETATGQDLCV
jgi:hypothetical protein